MRLGGAQPGAGHHRGDAEGSDSDSNDDIFGQRTPVENPTILGGGCCFMITFVLVCVLSMDAVPPLNYGIKYNNFNKVADTVNIHAPGRYFIWPWNRFLLFPANVRTIEFSTNSGLAHAPHGFQKESLQTRTSEGLTLVMKVSLQYQLKHDRVAHTYDTLNLNFQDYFVSQCRDALLKAASNFEATHLWLQRRDFQASLKAIVASELAEFADIWGLQLLDIRLKDSYEESIVNTQVQEQLKHLREKEQQATQIRAQTGVYRAEYDRQIKVIMAGGQANYTVIAMAAQAEAQKNTMLIEKVIFESVKNNLLHGAETELAMRGHLVDYQRYTSLNDLGQSSFLFGFAGDS